MTEVAKYSVTDALTAMLAAVADARLENRLLKLGEKYSFAADIFEYLAYNEKSYGAHSVERVSKITRVDYYDAIKTFKVLDEMGVGNFVVGRKGHDTRMIWKYDSRSVGKVGIRKSLTLLPLSKADAGDYDGPKLHEQIIKHEFFLRPNYLLKLELPADFNNKDLNRLTKWLGTLPFE